jgi:cytochrome c oxidase subunit II
MLQCTCFLAGAARGWMDRDKMRLLTRTSLALAALFAAAPAWAQAPMNWQLGFQPAHSPTQEGIEGLHAMVLWLMAFVTVFVAGLLAFCVWRYRASKNATASRVSHHTALEVAWTVIPVLILVIIAIPSFRLIYFQDKAVNPDFTIKVTGHQWYWEYAYPDQGGFSYSSYMVKEDELKPGDIRNLSVDNRVVVPAGKSVRILTTSADVIHSFFIPSLGVQRYAIPGRTIETWVRVDKPGVYYGQCNQICGTNHSVMPIAIEAMDEKGFAAWVEDAKKKYAAADAPAVQLAAAAAPAK